MAVIRLGRGCGHAFLGREGAWRRGVFRRVTFDVDVGASLGVCLIGVSSWCRSEGRASTWSLGPPASIVGPVDGGGCFIRGGYAI